MNLTSIDIRPAVLKMVELQELAAYTDQLLAIRDFSDYCPNGLQVEGRASVQRLVGGVTASQALLDAAVESDADAILVHHGYFWKGEDARIVGVKHRRLRTLISRGISLLAYHLPLDVHPLYGNNVQLAALLGLEIESCFGTAGSGSAFGLVGRLTQPTSGAQFTTCLKTRLLREPLHIPGTASSLQRIAWCTGAAQGFIEAAAAQGVEAFLTGEASEQTVHIARETGIHFFAAGHHATERYGVQALGRHLAQHFQLDFTFIDIDNPV
jgi:dinuclear metal center YbgI/SA1388 family protein